MKRSRGRLPRQSGRSRRSAPSPARLPGSIRKTNSGGRPCRIRDCWGRRCRHQGSCPDQPLRSASYHPLCEQPGPRCQPRKLQQGKHPRSRRSGNRWSVTSVWQRARRLFGRFPLRGSSRLFSLRPSARRARRQRPTPPVRRDRFLFPRGSSR